MVSSSGASALLATCSERGHRFTRATLISTGQGQIWKLHGSRPDPAGRFSESAILKIQLGHQAPERSASEARSLRLASSLPGPRWPGALDHWDAFLLMEYIEARPPEGSENLQTFGCELATLHRNTADEYGLEFDTWCGATPQQNQPDPDGWSFFAEKRLLALGRRAFDQGLLPHRETRLLEKVTLSLPDLIPFQPASLIHGDLWSGNHFFDPRGRGVLIDPALHYGWREADLAMMQLFGGFPDPVLQSYLEAWPCEPGLEERIPVYNLYHLLNHLLLFGSSYLRSVTETLRRYGGK